MIKIYGNGMYMEIKTQADFDNARDEHGYINGHPIRKHTRFPAYLKLNENGVWTNNPNWFDPAIKAIADGMGKHYRWVNCGLMKCLISDWQ